MMLEKQVPWTKCGDECYSRCMLLFYMHFNMLTGCSYEH